MSKTKEILLDLMKRLQADNSIRIDLSDLIGDLESEILMDNIGDEE